MNSIYVIYPRKVNGIWLFTDDRIGVIDEIFVGYINVVIDKLVQDIKNAESGFRLLFSDKSFLNYDIELTYVNQAFNGTFYMTDKKQEVWFCPVLLKFYNKSPLNIYGKAEQI